ncbi:hypothetical protein Poli38472_009024 [Pythium oligandrum]|uniref:SAM-dependent MTase RsmB/NOP-type domain-containing protein n=1 Tax=Pythium oligandrum TaxID=41045 RepID=A0A8K1CM46_PYTOL|nr:hypothetical protein Poli38472_009024 [Pythium oligandrum]|eukprot:TMW64857.1 hypothetical protein Poli38472_009024 [Pythium oligandrum]
MVKMAGGRNAATRTKAPRGAQASGKPGKAAKAASKPARVYQSDGDSDSDSGGDAARGPIPLKSLEEGNVRDFIAEFEQEHAQNPNKKKASKRARAELEQLELDKQKKKFRETRAEKVVWRKFDRENRSFEQYYRRVLQLEASEWEQFVSTLKDPVAIHVRVNGHYKSLCEIVTGTLELDFNLQDVVVPLASGEEAEVELAPVSWAEDKRTWKLTIDAKSFRKADKLRDLSNYFQAQGHLGTLQRLDPLTSVIPSFLDVQPGHRVLDLCGGGDQRATVILEQLNEAEEPGVLVVNERDAAMAMRAVQTLSRSLALSRETVVTAHKPLEFPLPSTTEGSGAFDRVICSAPCSGDGLIRRIPEKWRTWTPEAGLKSHASQVALATRAMSLVTVDGSLLYCTRSLNPIENEAVVAEILRGGDGAYELVDLSEMNPELSRKQGLSTWDVLDEQMNAVSMWETATPAQRKSLRASMWPPTDSDELHLERCVRLLPHQNDTNGVFIAVIRKLREPSAAVAGPTLPSSGQKNSKHDKKQLKASKKVLGSLSTLDTKVLRRLQSFYGIDSDDLTVDQVMERSGFAKDTAIHLVSSAVSSLIEEVYQRRLQVHRAGVDAFKRVVATGMFELTDDGARALLSVFHRRVLQLPMEEFSTLLSSKEMWLKNASESARAVLSETPEGSLVVVLDDMEPVQTADQDIVLVAMKRHNSYSLVSSPASIARIKTLLKELDANEDGEDGYDSFEYGDDED